MSDLNQKRCTSCHNVTPITGFNKNCRNSDGYETQCRVCTKAINAKLRQQPAYNSYKNVKVRAKSVGIKLDKAVFETYQSFYTTFKQQIDYLHNQDKTAAIQIVRLDPTKPFSQENIGFDYESGKTKQHISDGHLHIRKISPTKIEVIGDLQKVAPSMIQQPVEQVVPPIQPNKTQDPRARSLRYSNENCLLVAKYIENADPETLLTLQKIKRMLKKGYSHDLILMCFDNLQLEPQLDLVYRKFNWQV